MAKSWLVLLFLLLPSTVFAQFTGCGPFGTSQCGGVVTSGGTNPWSLNGSSIYTLGASIGIGTNNPLTSLDLGGTLYLNSSPSNLVAKSPNGTCYSETVDNNGYFNVTSTVCPGTYLWNATGWSGGGNFNNAMWDSATSGRVYMMSDVAGMWVSTNSGDSWNFSTKGLRNVMVSGMDQSVTNPNELVINSNSGVSESLDSGATWNSLNTTQSCTRNQCHNAIAISPTNANIIYNGTDGGAVMVTTNNGSTWSTLTTLANVIQAIVISKDASTLFIGTSAGVRVWNIAGGTYNDVTFSGNASSNINNVTEIRKYSYSGSDYVVATAGYALAYTTNNGSTWSYFTAISALSGAVNPTLQQIIRFDVSLSSGTPKIYAFTYAPTDPTHNEGVYVSSNNGTSWGSNVFANPTFDAVNNPTRAWTSGNVTANFLSVNPNNNAQFLTGDQWGVFRTDNSGSTYTEKIVGLQNTVMNDIQIAPDGSIIASGMDDGMARSTNNGASWTSLTPNGGTGQGYPQYAGHVWKFVTQGTAAQWQAGTGTIVACTSPWALQKFNSSGGSAQTQVTYSNNNGTSWNIATGPFNGVDLSSGMWSLGFCRSMAQSASGNKIWIGMDGVGSGQGGLYYSTDHGVNWTRSGQPGYDQTFYNGIDVLQSDTTGNTVIYAGFGVGNGGVSPYLTTNGGASWNYLNNVGNPNAYQLQGVYQIKFAANGFIYATTINGGLWMSQTGIYGSFSLIHTFNNSDAGNAILDGLTFDPNNPNRAFVSLSYPGDDGRIFYTKDLNDGASAIWVDITGNIPSREGSNKMAINYAEGTAGTLYVVTYGSGIFKLDLSEVN